MDDMAQAPIRWARRVQQQKVRQLYASDARGIVDEELIDDVGYAMYARCESIRAVTEAHSGRAMCHSCRAIIQHHWVRDDPMNCSVLSKRDRGIRVSRGRRL